MLNVLNLKTIKMKKYLLSVFAAASMLFAASCSEEENFAESNKQSVTFKVEVEGAGASSRTITDGSNHISIGKGQMVDKLFYAVYEHNDQANVALLEGQANVINGVTTVNIPLVNGVHYDLVFLAYNDADNAFGIKKSNELSFEHGVCPDVDLTQLTLRNNLVANQETYDAFYHVVKDYTTNTSSTTPVALHRMFAQLNVATTDGDLTNAKQLKVNVTQSAIKVLKNVPTTFNARGEKVGGHQDEFTFSVANVLKCSQKDDASVHGKILIHDNEQLTVKKNGQDEYFNYLAMAYVLADKEKSLHDVEVSFYRGEENGTSSELFHTRSIPSVPMQRLYRTNVTGNILTQQEAFSISLDLDFGDHNKTVGDVVIIPAGGSQALQAAIENAQPNVPVEIQLNGDIVLGEDNNSSTYSRSTVSPALIIAKDKNIILDLNGCTITGTDNETASFGLITLQAGSNLSIINSSENESKIVLSATNNRGWSAYSSVLSNGRGTLTIGKNVVIEHLGGTDMAYGIDNLTNGKGTKAVTTIDGATIKSPYRAIRQFLNGTEAFNELYVKSGTIESTGGNKSIWMQDPSTHANCGKLVIEAEVNLKGDVYFDITEGSTEWPVEVSIAASVIDDDSKIVVDGLIGGYEIVKKEDLYSVVCNYSVAGDIYSIYTAKGLKWVAEQVNTMEFYVNQAANIFDDKIVLLEADIDLEGTEWTPIGDYAFSRTIFRGIFDGKGHTVSNFKITQPTQRTEKITEAPYGLFGNVAGVVKNLNVDNAVVAPGGNARFAGALVGRLKEGALIENCHITNSSVTIEHWQVGGIAGQVNDADIKKSSITSSTITGYAGVGAIAGFLMVDGEYTIEECEVKNCELVQNGSFGEDYDTMYGLVAGALNKSGITLNINNIDIENNTIKGQESDLLVGYIEEGAKLNVDGFELVADGVLKNGVEYKVSSAEGLAYMNTIFANKTAGRDVVLNLTADIDFTGKTWTPVDSHADTAFEIAEINGNGHTISNLTINGQAMFTRFAGTGDVAIKNITFDNAIVNSNGINTSILTVQTYQNVLLDNVDVKESSITGTYKVAPLIGSVYNENKSSTITATLKNCDIEDVTVTCTQYDFCTAGMVAFVYEGDKDKITFENCTVKNVQLKAKPNGYTSHAAIYVNDAETDDCFNEAEGVTVTNVTFEALE